MKYTKQVSSMDEALTRNIARLKKPAVSVTVLIFSIVHDQLQLILIQRLRDPFKHFWSIPGDIIDIHESLEDAAKRVLYEKTEIHDVDLQQVAAFGAVNRDPRGRVITIGYFALLPQSSVDLTTAPDALHASWVPVNKLPKLAFDHKNIIGVACNYIKKELEYTMLAKGFLPSAFRLSDLQKVYEIIRGGTIDKRNFRKKILSLNILEETKNMYREGNHRPAKMYRFKQ